MRPVGIRTFLRLVLANCLVVACLMAEDALRCCSPSGTASVGVASVSQGCLCKTWEDVEGILEGKWATSSDKSASPLFFGDLANPSAPPIPTNSQWMSLLYSLQKQSLHLLGGGAHKPPGLLSLCRLGFAATSLCTDRLARAVIGVGVAQMSTPTSSFDTDALQSAQVMAGATSAAARLGSGLPVVGPDNL